LNKSLTKSIAMIVLAIFTVSALATLSLGHAYTYTPVTGLVAQNTLTIAGSSTVYPVAVEAATTFASYWNALVTANPSWDATSLTAATPIAITGAGSGTAIPALIAGTADIGEMSRPPKSGSSEWGATGMQDLQIWAVGIDSVGICIPTIMATWFPTTLTTQQVAELFMTLPPTTAAPAASPGTNTGLKDTAPYCDFTNATSYYEWAPNTPYFTTWESFLNYYYNNNIPSWVTGNATAAGVNLNSNINRAVRDPTSGTFDCFDNYFIIPNGFEAEYKTGSPAVQTTDPISGLTSQDMATYSFCETNQIVQSTMENGQLWIGFISAGILAGDPKLTAIDIQFNTSGTANTYNPPQTWGSAVAPTVPNIKYAVSNIKGTGATGQYQAWRWLWEVTPGQIPDSGALLVTGVWIAYMRASNPMTLPSGGTNATNTGSFLSDNQYIPLDPDDMSGGQVINSNLAAYTPLPGQTLSIPAGKVNFNDITYFVGAYINYHVNGIYNPYCDFKAVGTINFNDITIFVGDYIAYFTGYNPY